MIHTSLIRLPLAALFLLAAHAWSAADGVSGPLARDMGAIPAAPAAGGKSAEDIHGKIQTGQIKLINVFAQVPADIEVRGNLEYGKGGEKSLALDLYRPKDLKRPVPALVFIHGGGWKQGNRNDYRYYCIHYAQKGYVVATVSYRFSREAPFPAAVQDVKCAIRWLRANAAQYQIDPDKIAAIGGSAGGHLAMMVGYAHNREFEGEGGNPSFSSRVQAIVDLYGPCDLTTQKAQEADVVIAFLGGRHYDEAHEEYAKASPIKYVNEDSAPTLILHGTLDELVPISQSDALAARLLKARIPYLYDRLEGWPHTMDLAQDVNDRCLWLMDRFLARFVPLPK